MNNTRTTTTNKPAAPFAALVAFKEQNYLHGKYPTYVYRSDKYTISSNPIEHYKVLELLIEKELKSQYKTVTIFDNRILFADVVNHNTGEIQQVPIDKPKIVLQMSENFVHVDNRMYLGFLTPTWSNEFEERVQNDMYLQAREIRIDNNFIQHKQYVEQYKNLLNNL